MSLELLDPHMWSLETLFKNVYKVPVYQRPYSWDKEQIDTLLKDIFEAFKKETKEGYYTGNIIVYDKNEKIEGHIAKYDIIDGQQRITSFALIMLATYSISYNIGVEENDKVLGNIKDSLWKYVERKYRKDLKTVELNSIERDCFKYIYDICFENPKDALSLIKKYNTESEFDKRIVNNFENIYNTILDNIYERTPDGILNFAEYILQFIKFIVIEAHCKENEVFSMFESINSKGKQLETIDLIKTYIFSKLDEDSYEKYSKIWGNLIIKTKDKLYDYLYNYIKAYLSYYRQNINVNNFKSICTKELLFYFKTNEESCALKKLLDDLDAKVDFYNMLYSVEDAYKLIKSSKFRYFYEIFVKLRYQHPKALFFRVFVEFNEGKLTKNDVIDIVVETTVFMLKFLTICDRDSKDAITTFSNILNSTYNSLVNKDIIINYLQTELKVRGVTNDYIKNLLNTIDCYKLKKELGVSMLALYESYNEEEDIISYDQAYNLLKGYGEVYSLDHLLVQTPNETDSFKYYRNKVDNTLILKQGNDFPKDIYTGMDYDIFEQAILNKIGNLRIYYKDKNSLRQNDEINLPEYENFNTYKSVVERGNDIVNKIVEKCFPKIDVDIEKVRKITNAKDKSLYRMDKIIELGILKPGDDVYITTKPEESVATLIDSKYVNYKGNRMTLNEWGCSVTGWKSIRIYQYLAKVGEEETIQEKRLELMENKNYI